MTYRLSHRLGRALVVMYMLAWATAAQAVLPLTQPPDNSSLPTVEVWRIRIDNSLDGKIEVSLDHGASWTMIGRVSAPATESLEGYLAAGYAPIGTVSATAVHGIRIRLGGTANAYPNLINIVPREFATVPVDYGGHIAGASGIYTDIPSGVSLFRDFSPYVGSRCYLTDPVSGALTPLGSNYAPQVGDIITIIVKRRINEIRSIVFPNIAGGAVVATYADGTTQTVTHVVKAVTGIGRFDGTSYTGVGAVNTNHTCVITISTAPVTTSTLIEGDGPERRGGFQIEPYYHNTQTDEIGAPQVLVIGHSHLDVPQLEGREPLYYGGINLAWDPADPAHSWICDVQTSATGDAWTPMPEMIGDDDTIIARKGITAFRLHRDLGDEPDWLKARLAKDAQDYFNLRLQAALAGQILLAKGIYLAPSGVTDNDLRSGGTMAEFSLDGQYIGITNSPPYILQWDSRTVPNGEYALRTDIENSSGKVIDTVVKCLVVDN